MQNISGAIIASLAAVLGVLAIPEGWRVVEVLKALKMEDLEQSLDGKHYHPA